MSWVVGEVFIVPATATAAYTSSFAFDRLELPVDFRASKFVALRTARWWFGFDTMALRDSPLNACELTVTNPSKLSQV